MRRFLGTALALVVTLTIPIATSNLASNAADTPYRHTIVDSFAEGAGGGSEVSTLPNDIVKKIINSEEVQYRQLRVRCDSYTADPCASDSTGYSMRIFLPICASSASIYCIEGVEVSQGAGSSLVKGDFIGYGDGRTYEAVAAKGLPEAAATSRWKVSGVKSAGESDLYAVKVIVDAFKTAEAKDLWIFDVSAIVEPFTEGAVVAGQGDDACTSWKSKDVCAKRVDFKEKQRVALSLRLPSTVTGWLNGRLRDALITINSFNSTQNRLRVEAEPVTVPEVSVALTKEEFDKLPNPSFFLTQGEIWNAVNSGNPIALEWIKQLTGVMKDTASGEHTSWAFSTVGGKYTNDCFNDKTRLIGLVTTNAAVYAPGAPDFNNETLNYKVAGLHYRPDGKSLNVGTYDLVMRSDVARCLYRFTDAPISATVSISDDAGGEKRVETTVVSEKDGWLRLGAYGFTFSQPLLKVKLTGTRQQSASGNSNSNTQNSKANSNQKKSYTMTCKKGKVTKKIITAQPSCPSGWKKV
jgi:hypothetical protein